MKRIILRSALLAVVLATAPETCWYLNGLRPHFFSISEIIDILLFSVFLSLIVFASYLQLLKIKKERNFFGTKYIVGCSMAAIFLTCLAVGFDGDPGTSHVQDRVFDVVLTFLFFLFSSFVVLLVKKRI